jgi:sugar O-acyltransferase (sialic acid O-acetyltransferase NeuD family)
MKHLYIVGAGGLGRELLAVLKTDVDINNEWIVAGFVDSRPELKGAEIDGVPIIGGTEDAPIYPSSIFVAAIGDVSLKRDLVTSLSQRGAVFISTRTQCRIGERSRIGASAFQLNAFVSVDCVVEDFVYLDSGCVIGHDTFIGRFSHIGSGVFIGGRVSIGECVTVHPHAVVGQGIRVGEGATIGLGAVVFRDVPKNALVVGNPARIVNVNQN